MTSLSIENDLDIYNEDMIEIRDVGKPLPFDVSPYAVRRFIARMNGHDPDAQAVVEPVKATMSKTELDAKRKKFNLPVPGRNGVASNEHGMNEYFADPRPGPYFDRSFRVCRRTTDAFRCGIA